MAFTSNANITIFILMKIMIFICRGRNAGIENLETYRDKQGQARTHRERQKKTRTGRDRQRETWPDRDIQGKTGTDRDKQVPALYLALTSIIGK